MFIVAKLEHSEFHNLRRPVLNPLIPTVTEHPQDRVTGSVFMMKKKKKKKANFWPSEASLFGVCGYMQRRNWGVYGRQKTKDR